MLMTLTLSTVKSHCREVLALSQRMLDDARRGAWVEVAASEAARRIRLETLFPFVAGPTGAPAILADCIHQVLTIDREMLSLGQTQRTELNQALATLNRGERARAAYQANGG